MPSGLSPVNGSVGNDDTPVLAWGNVTDGDGHSLTYYVQVSNTSDFVVVNQSYSGVLNTTTLSVLTAIICSI